MEDDPLRGKVLFERFFWVVLLCLALAFFLFPKTGGIPPQKNPNPKALPPDKTSKEIAAELERMASEMEQLKKEMWRYDPQVLLERLRSLRRRISELTARLEKMD